MAVSQVEICNLALASFGNTNPIQDINEPSEEARQCLLHWGYARQSLLADPGYDWIFARRRISLAQQSTNDLSDFWLYCYAMPAKFLKLRLLEGNPIPGLSAPYELTNGKLYTNESPAWLRYVVDIDDVSLFSFQFVEALAKRLATRIVFPLTKDSALLKTAFDMDAMTVSSSSASDANNDYQEDFAALGATSILRARN